MHVHPVPPISTPAIPMVTSAFNIPKAVYLPSYRVMKLMCVMHIIFYYTLLFTIISIMSIMTVIIDIMYTMKIIVS